MAKIKVENYVVRWQVMGEERDCKSVIFVYIRLFVQKGIHIAPPLFSISQGRTESPSPLMKSLLKSLKIYQNNPEQFLTIFPRNLPLPSSQFFPSSSSLSPAGRCTREGHGWRTWRPPSEP